MLNKIHQHSEELSSYTLYVTLSEGFVDNFIGATHNHNSDNLTHVSRYLIHGIHSTFPTPYFTNHFGKDTTSKKKIIGVMACGSP